MYPMTPPPPPGTLAPPPPPPPAKSKSGRNLLIAIGAVFGFLVIVALLGDGVTTVDTVAAPTTTSPAVTIEPEPPTTTRVVTTTTRPVTTTTESMRSQLTAWYADNGTIFDSLAESMRGVVTAADTGDIYEMTVACGDMAVVVDEAQAQDPIPDPATNGHWQAGLAALDGAAEACVMGDYDLTGTYIVDGNEAIEAATAALEEVML